jgi:TPR repeat protein
MAPAMIAALIRRGDAMMELGDISAARLLYERAAVAGSGPAALKLARTYDPEMLAQAGARGIRGDPEAAESWYRRAISLGEAAAEAPLRQLTDARKN